MFGPIHSTCLFTETIIVIVYYSSQQGKQPIKRRFNEEDSALYTRLIRPKKSKKGEQHGVVKNNSLENTSVKSKLDEGIERDKSIVNSSHETVPESGETSDEELFKESFSPKKEESKLNFRSSEIQLVFFCWLSCEKWFKSEKQASGFLFSLSPVFG